MNFDVLHNVSTIYKLDFVLYWYALMRIVHRETEYRRTNIGYIVLYALPTIGHINPLHRCMHTCYMMRHKERYSKILVSMKIILFLDKCDIYIGFQIFCQKILYRVVDY